MQKNLTPRERTIFNLLIEGVAPKEIARKLGIERRTVDFHRNNIYNKLEVHSIQKLLAKYGSSRNGTQEKKNQEVKGSGLG